MAIARRHIITALIKDSSPYEEQLRALHYWAAVSSWSVPYSEGLQEPGYNVLEATPYDKIAAFDLSYQVIGCDELLGLTKTDRKMMRAVWGEPKTHTTAHILYRATWLEQEGILVAKRKAQRGDLLADIEELASMKRRLRIEQELVAKSKPLGLLARVLKWRS